MFFKLNWNIEIYYMVKIIVPIVLDQYTFYIRIHANYNIDMPQSRG